MKSREFSSSSLMDGLRGLEHQQVKVEDPEDTAAMEKELKEPTGCILYSSTHLFVTIGLGKNML